MSGRAHDWRSMEHPSESGHSQEQLKAMRFLKLAGLCSQAFVQGEEWVRSHIADLKIDLRLTTEYGEEHDTRQVDDIHCQIEILQSMLRQSLFDPVGEPEKLCIQGAATDLAQFALCIARHGKADHALSAVL